MPNKLVLMALGIAAVAGMFFLLHRMQKEATITNYPSQGSDVIE
jgi:hypothetical protein